MVSLDSPGRGMGVGGGISEGVRVLERCCGVCGRGHGSARHRGVVENVRRGRRRERVTSRSNLRVERTVDIFRGARSEDKLIAYSRRRSSDDLVLILLNTDENYFVKFVRSLEQLNCHFVVAVARLCMYLSSETRSLMQSMEKQRRSLYGTYKIAIAGCLLSIIGV